MNLLMDYHWGARSNYFIKASQMLFRGVTPGTITSLAFEVHNATHVFRFADTPTMCFADQTLHGHAAAQLSATSADAEAATVVIIHAAGAAGACVALLADVLVAQGRQAIDLPIEMLASGTYTLAVLVAGITHSTQFEIAR